MYKLVDDFNGHFWSNHKSLETARKAQRKVKRQFQARNPGADFCGVIVPAASEWRFDYAANEFGWSESLDSADAEYLSLLD